jgi:hypothetical protein
LELARAIASADNPLTAREWEIALALEFLASPEDSAKPSLSRWEQYAQVLLGANEFTFLD